MGCGTLLYCTVLYNTMLYCQYCISKLCSVQNCTVTTVQYRTVQLCTVQYCISLCSTGLYWTVLYCTVHSLHYPLYCSHPTAIQYKISSIVRPYIIYSYTPVLSVTNIQSSNRFCIF